MSSFLTCDYIDTLHNTVTQKCDSFIVVTQRRVTGYSHGSRNVTQNCDSMVGKMRYPQDWVTKYGSIVSHSWLTYEIWLTIVTIRSHCTWLTIEIKMRVTKYVTHIWNSWVIVVTHRCYNMGYCTLWLTNVTHRRVINMVTLEDVTMDSHRRLVFERGSASFQQDLEAV